VPLARCHFQIRVSPLTVCLRNLSGRVVFDFYAVCPSNIVWRRSELPTRLPTDMKKTSRTAVSRSPSRRSGASPLDYVLILATMLPIVAFVITKGKRMMALVWEMLCVQVSWPFM
jgi:uncharacterized RDD family membrane protein YckC